MLENGEYGEFLSTRLGRNVEAHAPAALGNQVRRIDQVDGQTCVKT